MLTLIKRKPKIIEDMFRTHKQEINNFGVYCLILNDHGCPKEVVVDDYVPVFVNSNTHVFSYPD